jgi:hypothetical protein
MSRRTVQDLPVDRMSSSSYLMGLRTASPEGYRLSQTRSAMPDHEADLSSCSISHIQSENTTAAASWLGCILALRKVQKSGPCSTMEPDSPMMRLGFTWRSHSQSRGWFLITQVMFSRMDRVLQGQDPCIQPGSHPIRHDNHFPRSRSVDFPLG